MKNKPKILQMIGSDFQSKYKHSDVQEKLFLFKGKSMTYKFCHVISSEM